MVMICKDQEEYYTLEFDGIDSEKPQQNLQVPNVINLFDCNH
jgi:hypothetical protein